VSQTALDFTGPLPTVQERQGQRDAERKRALERLQFGDHAEDIEMAHRIGLELAALDPEGCTSTPRIKEELLRRGLIGAKEDTRWLGGALTRRRWVAVRQVAEGSKSRRVVLWRPRAVVAK